MHFVSLCYVNVLYKSKYCIACLLICFSHSQVPGSTIVNVVCLYTASRPAREVIESIPGTVASAAASPISASHKTDGSKTPVTPKGTNHSVGTSSKSTQSTHSSTSSHSDEDSGRFSPQQVASHERCPVHRCTGWANAIYRFWGGTDAYRNRKLKLFPRMCKSSWAVQAAVGKKPALIGNGKLEVSYVRGKGYLEVDINIGSNTVATHILSMVSLPVYVRARQQFLRKSALDTLLCRLDVDVAIRSAHYF
jgi:hypothetical protein